MLSSISQVPPAELTSSHTSCAVPPRRRVTVPRRRLVSSDCEIGDPEFKLVIAGQQLVVDADIHRVAQVGVVAYVEPFGVCKVLKCLEHLVDRRRQKGKHARASSSVLPSSNVGSAGSNPTGTSSTTVTKKSPATNIDIHESVNR